MKNIMKRVLAMILALSMCMSMISTTAFSAYDEPSLSTEGMEHIVRIERPDPICGQEEHSHSDACYESEAILTCEDETEDHVHTDACYQTLIEGRLVCELEEHTHSDACYPVVEAPEIKETMAMASAEVVDSGNRELDDGATACKCGEATECACQCEDEDFCACECETCNPTQDDGTECQCGQAAECECQCEGEDPCVCVCETCNPAKVYSLTVTQSTDVAEDQIIVLDDVITYTITVVNDGNQTLSNVAITVALEGITVYSDNLPDDVRYDEENGTFTIASIAPCEDGDCVIAITYTYQVTENDVKAGKVVNTLTVTAEGADTSVTAGDETVTPVETTYSFQIHKVGNDTNGALLAGATFTLVGDNYHETFTSNAEGNIVVDGLLAGEYTLTETEAPAGYIQTADSWTILVGVSASATATAGGNTTAAAYDNGVLTIVNERRYRLIYDANGGYEDSVPVNGNAYTAGTTVYPVGEAKSPEKVIFKGWSLSEERSVDNAIGVDDTVAEEFFAREVTFYDGDITVFAVWAKDEDGNGIADYEEEYKLIYDANGGDQNSAPLGTVFRRNKSTRLDPKKPTSAEDVVFLGWTEGPNPYTATSPAEAEPTDVKLVTAVKFYDDDITVYAVWAVDANGNGVADYNESQYSVTYRWTDAPAGVTLPAAKEVLSGTKVEIDNAYTAGYSATVERATENGGRVRDTYTFSGWTLSSEGADVTVTNGSFTMPAGNVELVGQWTFQGTETLEQDDALYTVVHRYYTSADGENWTMIGETRNSLGKGKVGDTVTADDVALELSYQGSSYAFVSSEPAEGITLGLDSERNIITLIYHRTPVIYTLNYDANESDVENVPAPQSVTAYADAYVFTVSGQKPTREGYTFLGWATEADATVANVPANYAVAKSISEDEAEERYSATIYALWAVDVDGDDIPDEKETHYTVVYVDGVDGAAFGSQVFEYCHAGDLTPNFQGTPTREGYTFVRWNPTVSRTVNGDATYVAQWQVRSTSTPARPTTPTPDPVEEETAEPEPPVSTMPEIVEREPEEEEEDFAEPDVPLADLPVIEEEEVFDMIDVPLAFLPEEYEEELEEGDVPLADVPQTGDNSHLWTALTLISGAGLLGLTLSDRKRKDEDAE